MGRTCCPQYTIRLDAAAFKPGKKHRQVINRFRRFLETGDKPGDGPVDTGGKGKGKASTGDWVEQMEELETRGKAWKHAFTVS